MRRISLILGLLVVLCAVSVPAQYIVIGPPDDQTIVDTSYHPPSAPVNPKTEQPAMTGSTTTVTGIDLSQLDCSLFPQMCLYVDATNGSGIPVPGLNADSFCLYQDGVPVSGFTVQQITTSNCITSICLVVDVSGSMADDHRLDSAKAAMHRFVNNMDPYDQVAIVKFSNCWTIAANFTSNQTTLHNVINGLTANGYTAVFDGIYKGVDITRLQAGAKAVIAFTDGVENRSQSCSPNPPDGVNDNTYADDSTTICNLATLGGVPIYTFNLGPIDNTWFNSEAMQAFANGSGGFWAHAPTGSGIDSLYTLIKQRLCSRYYICYNSTDTIQNGDVHSVKVCKKSGANCTPCDSSFCQEVAPPVIVRTPATIDLSDTCQSYTAPLNICAWVTDKDTPKAGLTVTLYYRLGAVSYTSVTMTPTGGSGDSTFCASIPGSALACNTQFDYYITASDGQATVTAPAVNPQASPSTITICGTNPPVANAGSDQTILQCSAAQICLPASCSDPDNNLKLCQLISGPGTYDGTNICFTPTGTLNYEFVIKATDSCNLVDYDTVVVYYTLNQPPTADAGRDSTLFLCAAQQISWPASCGDPNGNLSTCQLISGTGTYDGSQISFTPASSGSFPFILKATDACGLTDYDTAVINVTLNAAPVCSVPNDTTIFQCAATQICLPVSATDVNGNLRSCQITSGPGSLVGGNWCYTPSSSQTATVTIRCEDSCNAYCESTFTVTIGVNVAPNVAFGNDTTVFQCAAAQVCLPYAVSDANGNLTLEQLVSGSGTIDTVNNRVCFTPPSSGTYTFIVGASDACTAEDRDTIVVTVNQNNPPVANAGADQNLFQCAPAPVSWAASCSDPDGNLVTCQLISGTGTYNGSQISFTPAASGSYQFILQATDACGAIDYDTAVVTVTLNVGPVCQVPNDTTIFQCTATQISLPVSATDANGNLRSCQITSGPGSLVGGNWRYTPASSQVVAVTVRCEDSCNAYCQSTFTVTIGVNVAPSIAFGNDTTIFQCTAAQICLPYTVSDANGNLTLEQLVSGSGTIDTVNNRVCFTPSATGVYTFIVKAQDACSVEDRDTIVVTVNQNNPPVASAGADQNLFQCTPTLVSWAASCSDPDGNLSTCQLISGTGTYNGSQISFTPAASGTYQFILQATDACGVSRRDTAVITVTLNVAPNIAFGNDTSIFQCTGAQICLPYTVSDANNNVSYEQLVSGSGTIDTVNNRVCFTPASTGVYTFIVRAQDACGLDDRDTIVVTVNLNAAPSIAFGNDTTIFQCTAAQICLPYTVSDANGNLTLEQLVSGSGTIDTVNNRVCFTPSATGVYTFIVKAQDACSVEDRDTIVVTVNQNNPPVASAGADQNLFQCTPTLVSWAASCSDPDGNLSTCQLISGTGTYNGSQISFTPAASGTYQFILQATDACGVSRRDTAVITVTLNSAPTVAFGNDTSIFLCQPQSLCMTYQVSDPNSLSGLTELMVSGYGTIDTVNNRVCFTPTTAGTYQFVVEVMDGCGVTDRDTVVATVTFGEAAAINCPTSPITSAICGAGQICQQLAITPAGATITTSFGTYSGGNLCFQADTSGTYIITVIASTTCGADTCQLTFNVTIGGAPQLTCPAPQSKFICSNTNLCVPVGVVGPGATVVVTPIGSYTAGEVCFPADSAGHYVLTVVATTFCGADTCQVVVDVSRNHAPVATNPDPNPATSFLCAPAQICYQFQGSDVDGGTPTWTKLSGDGTVSSGGQWCFTPAVAGSYTVVAAILDSCGAADTTTLTYQVTLNQPPVIAFGNDTTYFQCATGQICVPYTVSDPNSNIATETLLSGPGSIDTVNNRVCFTPTGASVNTLIVRATDACGLTDQDTIVITVNVNNPPVANAGADQTLFQCTPTLVSWAASCSDPDGNLSTCELTSGTGTYNGSQISFTPAASGSYQFILKATDACGTTDYDTAVINVTLNVGPVCQVPNDTNIFQCTAAPICLPVSATDANGNLRSCQITSGPGSLVGGSWCYTPTASQTVTVTVRCEDSCNAFCESTFSVTIGVNVAPSIALGNDTTVFQCNSAPVCLPYSVADANGNVTLEQLVSGSGTIDTVLNQICFTPAATGVYTFIVRAQDACNVEDRDTIVVTVNQNNPPVASAGADQNLFQCAPTQVCWAASGSDPDGNLSSVTLVSGVGTYSAGQICFTPSADGIYTFILQATDQCGVSVRDTAVITININEAPVCSGPPASNSYFQCVPTQVSLPVSATDADGNFKYCQIVSGPGSIVSGQWVYTPTTSQTVNVTIQCLDSCNASCQFSFAVQFTINDGPVATLGNDTTFFQCAPAQICFPYTVSDVNANVTGEQLIASTGTIDTALNQICFTPVGFSTDTFRVRVIDACGVADEDTIIIRVNGNNPPVANAGADQTLFKCAPVAICWAASATDPNNNIDSVTLVSGPGTYSGGQICFTPSVDGVYTFVLRAKDVCGLIDLDTAVITINMNEPPVCNMPPDTSVFFQCTPTQVSLPVSGTDADGNFDHCEIVSGPGSLVSGNWVYTPSVDEFRKVVIRCLDQCGALCTDSFFVRFNLNAAPVVNSGKDTTYFICETTTLCWNVTASDEDNNLQSVQLTTPVGAYNVTTHQICFTVPYTNGPNSVYTFIIKATDSCGLARYDTTNITIDFNNPPVISAPPDFTAMLEQGGPLCFDVTVSDPDNNLDSGWVTPFGTYNPTTHRVCFDADTSGMYCMVIRGRDQCGLQTDDSICVEVQIDECMRVQIEKLHQVIQGQYANVDLFLNGSGKDLGGFNFLISYDQSALTASTVIPGSVFTDCGWEYFTYRTGADGNCGTGCPTGLLRIVGIAETNNGAYHPGCFLSGMVGTLAEMQFLVSNDRTLECQYAPIRFFWLDCGDNTFSSPLGDTLWIERNVFDFELQNITNHTAGFPGYLGAPDLCLIGGGPGKPAPIRCIDFTNGGIDIACADSIDARGDVNLNGLAYEVADAVMFTNYFIHGLSALGSGQQLQGAIAASDVNADGITLTVADLVYLIRVIVGDASGYEKPNPGVATTAEFKVSDDLLSIARTDEPIGAIYVEIPGDVHPRLHESVTNMELKYSYDGTNTRVLIANLTSRSALNGGPVLHLDGGGTVKTVEIGSAEGSVMTARVTALPDHYSLSQNYPNPFNPVTTIKFALPRAGEYTLTIYNVLGQEVTSWSDKKDAGFYQVEWDAGSYASGVYFYRLTVGEYSATKKMVLLK